ncbi:MAG TPA: GNAT family N-acetyltransferase [Kofleriaceae bacterium]
MFAIRLLEPSDAEALRALRLAALKSDPDAFLTTWEEERERTAADFAERLRDRARDPACSVHGGFDGGALSGMVGTMRGPRAREQHKAAIWGLWVAPLARRRGLARGLMRAAIDHLRTAGGVEQVQLLVTSSQTAAHELYLSLGFTSFGREARAMKVGERYLDEEHMVHVL